MFRFRTRQTRGRPLSEKSKARAAPPSLTRRSVLPQLRNHAPAFRDACDAFVSDWVREGDLPLYILMSDLVRHCSQLLADRDISELRAILALVERWIGDGDDDLRTLAIVGFIEDATNANLHGHTTPDDLVPYLPPRCREAWDQVLRHWDEAILREEAARKARQKKR
ncbi:MAG: hypothetical protein AAF366_14540 [Pseudomonadota bacterium]